MSDSAALIITHGDVDGMVCGAQLIRLERGDCDLVFSNANYIESALKRIVQSDRKPIRIYVSDIPANPAAVEAAEALAGEGSEVFWIDHHPWPDGVKAQLEKGGVQVVYNNSLRTPAGVLLGRWLADRDVYYKRLGDICYAAENGSDWERDWFRLLSSRIACCRRDILERLAFDQEFTEDDLARIERKKDDERQAEQILRSEPQCVTTRSGKTMLIYDTSASQGIYLGNKVFAYHDGDYCLIRISRSKWQLACNPSRRTSMGHLLGGHKAGDNNFFIGGRENALLSIKTPVDSTHHDFHQSLIAWLAERLR